MERVIFLIEETNEQIRCLLNPESLVMRRMAGVAPRRAAGEGLAASTLSDEPLLYTGRGRTEIDLDLLFDVTLAGSSIQTDDVRVLTQPFWNLAENGGGVPGAQPPQVRFLWGKYWDIPAIVLAVAERLEQFTAGGAARRSWLRMRLLRVAEPTSTPGSSRAAAGTAGITGISQSPAPLPGAGRALRVPEDQGQMHVMTGGGSRGEDGGRANSAERIDQVAAQHYGDPALWRVLAEFNDIADPLHVEPGRVLRIPPASALRGAS